jgi:hypothetical protein
MIVLLALLLRLAYLAVRVWRMHAGHLDPAGFGDEVGQVARSIAAGKGFSSPLPADTGPTAWFAPVFPYLLAAVLKLFGANSYASFIVALTLDAAFSALTCIPVFFIAQRLGGRAQAVWTAWAWALYPLAVLLAFDYVWYSVLSGLIGAIILWSTMAIPASTRLLAWAAYGLLWGLQLMTNPSFLSLIPFIGLWLIWDLRKQGRPWRRLVATAAFAAALCCVPWTLRNYAVFHEFVPIRSNLGLELWRYNTDHQLPHPSIDPAERSRYAHMGEIAYMREKRHQAVQFILAHPALELRLTWARFVTIWTGSEHPMDDLLAISKVSHWARCLSELLVAALALLGLALLYLRQNKYFWLLAPFPVVFPLIYYITVAAEIYRHPIDPALIVLAIVPLRPRRALDPSPC